VAPPALVLTRGALLMVLQEQQMDRTPMLGS